MKKLLILILLLFLTLPQVSAKQGHMNLLAVKESTNEGSTADLYLEIKPGRGRVFIETIPLSKLDTQISTRFAADIACNYLNVDCSKYDFFYTVNADSPIIGGPSAGAATAVLTVAVLEGIEIKKDISITGTINSGGLIGPVGSLKEKIEAAASLNMSKVLIPKGERFLKEFNLTLDLADYAKKYNITIVEVTDLTEALYHFTGKKFKKDIPELVINPEYKKTMRSLAINLCNRTEKLRKEVSEFNLTDISLIDKGFVAVEKLAINLTEKGNAAFKSEMYYSAASYCFGANVNYKGLLLKLNKYNDFESVEKEIKDFDGNLNNISIKTITDLQAYMVVK